MRSWYCTVLANNRQMQSRVSLRQQISSLLMVFVTLRPLFNMAEFSGDVHKCILSYERSISSTWLNGDYSLTEI